MGGYMQVTDHPHRCFVLLPYSGHPPQPQGHVQVLLNILRGFTAQAALDAPRFCISAGIPDAQNAASKSAGDINSEVYFEEGIPIETVNALKGLLDTYSLFLHSL